MRDIFSTSTICQMSSCLQLIATRGALYIMVNNCEDQGKVLCEDVIYVVGVRLSLAFGRLSSKNGLEALLSSGFRNKD